MSTGFRDEREVDVKFLCLLLLCTALCIVCYLCGKEDAREDRARLEKYLCYTSASKLLEVKMRDGTWEKVEG